MAVNLVKHMININEVLNEAAEGIKKISSKKELDDFRVLFLGRKGKVTLALRSLGIISLEERNNAGKVLNNLKEKIEFLFDEREKVIFGLQRASLFEKEWIDVTSPGVKRLAGYIHPVSKTIKEMVEIFAKLGFDTAEGPEIETDWYNFEALNMPKGHPVRDTQATYFVDDNLVLRTQTSPVQIRVMQSTKPPIRIIVPGKTYRRDSDITHTPMFHQLEGLVVDKSVTLADLKGTMEVFVELFFGEDRKTRLRPHHFAFTEPSVEMDIFCGLCGGKGCRSCKYSGWLEVVGAGMVHPNVLRNGGIDPKKYQGFAFGFGIERLAMLKYNLDDARLLYDNDLRFLEQF